MRKLAFSFIVCGVLIAFFLESNLAIWSKSPKKTTIDSVISLIGFYHKKRISIQRCLFKDVTCRVPGSNKKAGKII